MEYVHKGTNAVAIGLNAGQGTQGASAVAIGDGAGQISQSNYSVAVGLAAGLTTQGDSSVAVGRNAGRESQGITSTAVGYNAARFSQGTFQRRWAFKQVISIKANPRLRLVTACLHQIDEKTTRLCSYCFIDLEGNKKDFLYCLAR